VDFLAGLKAARPRDYLKEAVQQALSKKPPKVGLYKLNPVDTRSLKRSLVSTLEPEM
jgi:hypothetical protein